MLVSAHATWTEDAAPRTLGGTHLHLEAHGGAMSLPRPCHLYHRTLDDCPARSDRDRAQSLWILLFRELAAEGPFCSLVLGDVATRLATVHTVPGGSHFWRLVGGTCGSPWDTACSLGTRLSSASRLRDGPMFFNKALSVACL